MALAAGGVASAQAAGPNYLEPGQAVTYPTWWGYTTLCAYNYGPNLGRVYVAAYGGSMSGGWITENIWIDPYTTKCIRRQWYGNPVQAKNTGWAPVSTYTY